MVLFITQLSRAMRVYQFCLMDQKEAQDLLMAQKQGQFFIQRWDR